MKLLKRKLLSIFDEVVMFIFQNIYGVQKKYAVFESFCGVQYSDNPRAISEKLHELDPDYQIIWLLNSNTDKYSIIPNYVKIVKRNRINRIREISRCSVYVTNENLEPGYYKNNKKQLFIQTWHGDRGFKKILYEAYKDGKRPIPVVDNKYTDLCIAGSKVGEEMYRSAFHYNGKIFNEGTPRNDKLIIRDSLNETKIRKKLNIIGKKVLLYAPTFRDNSSEERQAINIDILKTLKTLKKKFNQEWICLIRSHPGSKLLDNINNENIVDVSDYPDMADLLSVTDLLITDYSASCGDFILTYKPIILCQFDRDEFIKKCRSFRIIPEDVGFIIAYNQQQLENIINTYNHDDYKESCEKIMKKLNVLETGTAALKICEIIKEWEVKK